MASLYICFFIVECYGIDEMVDFVPMSSNLILCTMVVKYFLNSQGYAEGSDQISHFKSAEVGDEILVNDKVCESSGIARGSDENCGS